jgi:hypothetical protein
MKRKAQRPNGEGRWPNAKDKASVVRLVFAVRRLAFGLFSVTSLVFSPLSDMILAVLQISLQTPAIGPVLGGCGIEVI